MYTNKFNSKDYSSDENVKSLIHQYGRSIGRYEEGNKKLVEEAEAGGALYTFLGALVIVGFLAIRVIY